MSPLQESYIQQEAWKQSHYPPPHLPAQYTNKHEYSHKEENKDNTIPTGPVQTNPYRENTNPQDFLNIELLKHLRKDFPNSKDWVKFSGEGEYNHHEFIDWVDQLKEENMMPDILITSKLALVFSGVAREWYIEKRRDTGSLSWDQWKEAIEERFGTDTWKNQLEEAFLNDNFNPAYHRDCLAWAIKQKKRIRAFSPDSTSKRIVEKILFRMGGDIRNSVRSLI